MLPRRTIVKFLATSQLVAWVHADARAQASMNVRTPGQVAHRSLALLAVIRQALGHAGVLDWIEKNAIASHLSTQEAAFLRSASPTAQQRIQFSWRSEALVPLLWSLQQLDEMPPSNRQVDMASVVKTSGIWSSPAAFIASAKLRSQDVLLDARQDALEANWKARDAQIHERPIPPDVDAGIVQERHHGLNWLVGDSGDDWDTVTTDT